MSTGRQKIRSRRVGSNIASDKYTIPVRIEDKFKDLAWFVCHTGFTNVRNRNKSDIGIIPIFRYIEELGLFLQQTPSGDEDIITCGFAFTSLDIAWRLFQQNLMLAGNTLFYIMDELRFILYIRRNGITQSTFDVITDPDIDHTLGPLYSTFPPEDRSDVSIDTFLSRHVQSSTTISSIPHIYNAISLMFPRYLRIHRLSIGSIANRVAKCRRREIDGSPV